MSSGARVIVPLAFSNKALASAIFAVSAIYLGRMRDDAKLRGLAMASYPTALSRFRSELVCMFDSRAEMSQRDTLMATALTLILFEWLANGPDGEGYRRHIQGALDMMKLSGIQTLQSSVARQVYIGIQSIVLSEALRSHKTTFVAAEYWSGIPRQPGPKAPREQLFDIMFNAPDLLERAEHIKSLVSAETENTKEQVYLSDCNIQSSPCSLAVDFLRDCDSLLGRLDNWICSLQELENGPIWWYLHDGPSLIYGENLSDSYQPIFLGIDGKPRQLPLIYFSSPKIPLLLLNYWTVLLEISTAILEVRSIFYHDPLFTTSIGILGIESPSLSMEDDAPTKFALRICQTVIHLSSTLEGCTVAYVPIKLAVNHFTSLLSSAYQSHWENYSDMLKNCERAQVGLDCSMKALKMLQNTLQNFK